MVSDLRLTIACGTREKGQPSAIIFDGRMLQSTCESGSRAGCDGYKRKKGSKVRMAVDTLGHLLAVQVTPANEQERASPLAAHAAAVGPSAFRRFWYRDLTA